ncbi:MAG UNVERIFIED_CONTAM: hypothetical protein LVT10_24685 [Anaerolineae bacterium]|jgi:hypothetical protein
MKLKALALLISILALTFGVGITSAQDGIVVDILTFTGPQIAEPFNVMRQNLQP